MQVLCEVELKDVCIMRSSRDTSERELDELSGAVGRTALLREPRPCNEFGDDVHLRFVRAERKVSCPFLRIRHTTPTRAQCVLREPRVRQLRSASEVRNGRRCPSAIGGDPVHDHELLAAYPATLLRRRKGSGKDARSLFRKTAAFPVITANLTGAPKKNF